MAPLQLLLTGATGFIGGSTLYTLLQRPDVRDGLIEITCLVRGEERAQQLRHELGVKTVVADLDQEDIMERSARESDVIIHTANSDHPKGAAALVRGLEKRAVEIGRKLVFIHSSGTGALTDDARGEYAAEKIYQDLDCSDIRAIPTTYIHRGTDIIIQNAAERGNIRGYVVMPPLIYGRGKGPFSRTSVQIPALIRATLKLGQAPYIGKGLGLWNGVHIQNLVDLYMILLDDALLSSPQAPTGAEGYYFCATDSFQWKELAGEIGKQLFKRGVIGTPEPRMVSREEEVDVFGKWSGYAYASNSRSKAGKAYELGWRPKYHTNRLFHSIDEEYDAVIEEGAQQVPKVHFDDMYNLEI
ncbi:hypothetical protein VNI00_001548 [Paramarasmius palmivorus]|uniref:NAD-dependent epimerase/dehydratase domain-containing protein n=1 Tax=Paramarasmius palmivorus TaxID=297713 RepID=A0AAW0E4H5_9AGAR